MGLFNFWKPKTNTYIIDLENTCIYTMIGKALANKRVSRTGSPKAISEALQDYCYNDAEHSKKMYELPKITSLEITKLPNGFVRLVDSVSKPMYIHGENLGELFIKLSRTYSFSRETLYPSNASGGSKDEWAWEKLTPSMGINWMEAVKTVCLASGIRLLSGSEHRVLVKDMKLSYTPSSEYIKAN